MSSDIIIGFISGLSGGFVVAIIYALANRSAEKKYKEEYMNMAKILSEHLEKRENEREK